MNRSACTSSLSSSLSSSLEDDTGNTDNTMWINVGGKEMLTRRVTLERSLYWKARLSFHPMEHDFRHEPVDRNGDLFALLLDHLRDNGLYFTNVHAEQLKAEIHFFGCEWLLQLPHLGSEKNPCPCRIETKRINESSLTSQSSVPCFMYAQSGQMFRFESIICIRLDGMIIIPEGYAAILKMNIEDPFGVHISLIDSILFQGSYDLIRVHKHSHIYADFICEPDQPWFIQVAFVQLNLCPVVLPK